MSAASAAPASARHDARAARWARGRRYLDVVRALTRRELRGGREAGQRGVHVAFLVPAAFLLLYGFVFGHVIPVRLGPEASGGDYAFFLFSGLVLWNCVADTLGRAPFVYETHAALLRKAGFPASAPSVACAAAAFVRSLAWLLVFAIARLAASEPLHASALLAPLVLALAAIGAAGAALVLAALGALVRDLRELLPPALTLLLFLSPILYPASRLEAVSPVLLLANPLAPLLALLRAQLLGGSAGAPSTWAAALAWTAAAVLVGGLVHRRARPVVADFAG